LSLCASLWQRRRPQRAQTDQIGSADLTFVLICGKEEGHKEHKRSNGSAD
jgi:hypothetical protein